MSTHVYKHLELTGTSDKSIEEAVGRAIERAAQTIRNMHWLQVSESALHII